MLRRLRVSQAPDLLRRVFRFALAARTLYRKLPSGPDAQIPGVQFYKAATSSWANYRACQRGRSRAEFIAKLGSVVEETDEAVGWLEFMRDAGIASDEALLAEARELLAIFTLVSPPLAETLRLDSSSTLLFTFYFLLFTFSQRLCHARLLFKHFFGDARSERAEELRLIG